MPPILPSISRCWSPIEMWPVCNTHNSIYLLHSTQCTQSTSIHSSGSNIEATGNIQCRLYLGECVLDSSLAVGDVTEVLELADLLDAASGPGGGGGADPHLPHSQDKSQELTDLRGNDDNEKDDYDEGDDDEEGDDNEKG